MRLLLPSSGAEPASPANGETRRLVVLFWGVLLVLTLVRICLAATLGISPDEAYYWTWSRHLQAGYLDHPPMIALWIRLGTALCGDSAFGIRVLGPISALLGSIVLVRAGRDLLGSVQAGYRASLLLNATLMLGLGAATATPDTPLVFFLTLTLWALGRLIVTGQPRWWLATGLFFGLAFDSKYTAVLPAFACGLWVLATPAQRRHWLWLAGGAVIGLVAILPVLAWNAAHHWASFLKQGGRASDWHPLKAVSFLAELAGGQIGLATPLVFLLFCIGIIWCLKRAGREPVARLLACLCIVPVAVFVQHAFGGRVQANWPVVIYPAAALAAAATHRRIGYACALGLAITALISLQGMVAPLHLSAHHDVIARQTADWSGLAHRVQEEVSPGHSLVVGDYALASIMRYETPDQLIYSYDSRWGFLGGHDMHERAYPGPKAQLLLRESEKPDLPAAWLGAAETGRFCRLLRGQPIICYRLINLNLPAGTAMHQLP